MIRARFRTTLSPETWVADVSTRFPAVTFRLLTGVPLDDRAIELGEVRGEGADEAASAIRSHPAVTAYEPLYTDAARAMARYETTDTRLYEFLGRSSLPPEFPVVVRDGAFAFDLTGTREQFEAVVDALAASEHDFELRSVTTGGAPDDLLTVRQRECLDVALREGYFEVPRGCKLADVAAALDVDPSTASELLRRGQARIVTWYLVGPE